MKSQTITCDICEVRKQETNHWWGAAYNANNHSIILRPWNEWGSEEEFSHHLCGKGCALVLVERYLD